MEGNCLKVKIECYKMDVELNITANYCVRVFLKNTFYECIAK